MKKWIEKEHRYVPYSVPDDWHCLSEEDCEDCRIHGNPRDSMLIDCASCGDSVPCDKCYKSLSIRTDDGFSYLVCRECHHEEYAERPKTPRTGMYVEGK